MRLLQMAILRRLAMEADALPQPDTQTPEQAAALFAPLDWDRDGTENGMVR